MMGSMKCPECGNEIADDVKVCPSCGFHIKKKFKMNLLKVGALINIISVTIFALIFIAYQIMAQTDTSTEESTSSSVSISFAVNPDDASKALSILIVSCVLVLIFSIFNLLISKKMINIMLSMVMFIGSVISGVLVFTYGFSMFICCLYWILLLTPILNIVGSILCLIGSFMQSDD